MSDNSNTDTENLTDGRTRWEWESKYPPQARREILFECLFLMVLLFSSFFVIFASWKEWYCSYFSVPSLGTQKFKIISYYMASGLMGGVIFTIKMSYRMIAKGWWHQERRAWRLMSPFVAMTVAFIIGHMKEISLVAASSPTSISAAISIGFLAGHFADHAVAKMHEIAEVIFGRSMATKSDNGK